MHACHYTADFSATENYTHFNHGCASLVLEAQCLFVAGQISGQHDRASASQMSQASGAISRPVGSTASKQAAVASMFKAAKPSTAASSSAALDLAATVPALNGKDHVSVKLGSNPPNPSAGMQGAAQEASAAAERPCHMEAELHSSRAVHEDMDTGCNHPCANELGQMQHIDQATLASLQSQLKSDAHASKLGHQAASVASEATQGGGGDASSDALLSIDLAEQKQILHELWLEKNAVSARTAAKRPAAVTKKDPKRTKIAGSDNGRQKQISAMLKTAPPP